LRVGKIGKDFLCGLDDDILTLRHGVPLFWLASHDYPAHPARPAPFLAPDDGEKLPP
jgi:hypothetical protein